MKLFTKRNFLKSIGALGCSALGTWIYATRIEPHWIEFVRRDLPISGLPKGLVGKTLLQLSDIHIGHRVSDQYLMDVFERVTALRPDIIVYTGDFISHHEGILAQAERMFPLLPHGRLATLGVLGNHDYGKAWSQYDFAQHMVNLLHASGIDMLRNESRMVEGLKIIGIDDLWANRLDITQALNGHMHDTPTLALCHNPDAVDLPDWNDFEGWILAGHTHGGQCKPPFLPPPLLPVINTRYTAGVFDVDWRKTLYINRGVGHLLKARFNVRPEATIFKLGEA